MLQPLSLWQQEAPKELSDTLDVLFGIRDFDPGAVVLPNRSAGDVGCSLFRLLVSICHSVVRYNAMHCLSLAGWE